MLNVNSQVICVVLPCSTDMCIDLQVSSRQLMQMVVLLNICRITWYVKLSLLYNCIWFRLLVCSFSQGFCIDNFNHRSRKVQVVYSLMGCSFAIRLLSNQRRDYKIGGLSAWVRSHPVHIYVYLYALYLHTRAYVCIYKDNCIGKVWTVRHRNGCGKRISQLEHLIHM